MNNISIVVLSKYPDIWAQCLAALRQYAPSYRRVLVVDESEGYMAAHDVIGCEVIRTQAPYSMARNGSFGLMASWPDDVLYMGDDVQLTRSGVVEELQRIAYSDESLGMLAPRVYGACGNALQQASGKQIIGDFEFSWRELVMVCVFIKRQVLDEVGYLDPRFIGYGGDDIDFGQRMARKGWRFGVTPRVTVVHGFEQYDGTATFRRAGQDVFEQVARAQARMEEKAWEQNVRV